MRTRVVAEVVRNASCASSSAVGVVRSALGASERTVNVTTGNIFLNLETTGSNILNFGTTGSDLISIWERQDQILSIW